MTYRESLLLHAAREILRVTEGSRCWQGETREALRLMESAVDLYGAGAGIQFVTQDNSFLRSVTHE